MVLLELQEVHSFYGTSHILHGVSLNIEDGGMVSVLGRNGVGKSTMLRSVIGALQPRRGKVIFKGKDVTHLKAHQRARLGMSYVPQGRDLIPDITAEENLLLALMGKGNGSKRLEIPEYIFEYFPAIRGLLKRRAGVLSGGQQQQIAIARALIQEPDLLLLDEPTEGLQPSVVTEIQEIIRRIHVERGCAILLVEQNLDFVRDVAEHFAMMENGRIFVHGHVSELNDDVIRKYIAV